ncbi:MAG: hypothetical protein D6714_01215, partial [Bacteroidetes bacterium]
MRTWLKITGLAICCFWSWLATAQIQYKLDVMPDGATYRVSMIPDTSWSFPFNLTASAQVTLSVPHGKPPYRFVVEDLTALTPNTEWLDNVHIEAPLEAPDRDYISFALVSLGTDAYSYVKGQEVPLFSFRNGADGCVDSIGIIDHQTDPFMPPNSAGANIGNAIVTLGGGLSNVYTGNWGTGRAPCLPELICDPHVSWQTVELCEGETWAGRLFQQDTLIEQHFISCSGCDSLVQTDIRVFPHKMTETDASVCLGEPWNGAFFYSDTTLTEYGTTWKGCDSVQVTHLHVLAPSISNVEEMLCYGDTYGGTAFFGDTILYEIYPAANGCDSIVTALIFVETPTFIQTDTVVCEGSMVGGQIFETDGFWEENIPGTTGCDSLILHTEVSVLPASRDSVEIWLAEGQNWGGQPWFSDTTVVQILQNEAGCDSVLTADIVVFPPNTLFADTTLCEGQILAGHFIEHDTLIIDTLTDQSLKVYQVAVIPTPVETRDTLVCAGSWLGGGPVFSDTLLIEVFNGTDVCDSVRQTQVTVLPEVLTEETLKICFGEPFEGIIYEKDTLLSKTLPAASGCDSLILTHLEILPEKTGFEAITLCAGDIWNGTAFYRDTSFSQILSTTDGCDSLVQMVFTVFPLPEPEIIGETTFCAGDTTTLKTADYPSVVWSNGAVDSFVNVWQSGYYEAEVTDLNGCRAKAGMDVSAVVVDAEPRAFGEGCRSDSGGKIEINHPTGGMAPYLFSADGGQTFQPDSVFVSLAPGGYEVVVEDLTGCRWTGEVVVPEKENPTLFLPEFLEINLGDSIALDLRMNFDQYDSLVWSPPAGLSCEHCLRPMARPAETTWYGVQVWTTDGCMVSGGVAVYVAEKARVFFPNVFSPNGDGQNDWFFPYAGVEVETVRRLAIFDRNGGLVFEQKNMPPNVPAAGWDGGQYPPGVYT